MCQINNARAKNKDLNFMELPIPVENTGDLQGSSAAAGVTSDPPESMFFFLALQRAAQRDLPKPAAPGQAAAAAGVMKVLVLTRNPS